MGSIRAKASVLRVWKTMRVFAWTIEGRGRVTTVQMHSRSIDKDFMVSWEASYVQTWAVEGECVRLCRATCGCTPSAGAGQMLEAPSDGEALILRGLE